METNYTWVEELQVLLVLWGRASCQKNRFMGGSLKQGLYDVASAKRQLPTSMPVMQTGCFQIPLLKCLRAKREGLTV